MAKRHVNHEIILNHEFYKSHEYFLNTDDTEHTEVVLFVRLVRLPPVGQWVYDKSRGSYY